MKFDVVKTMYEKMPMKIKFILLPVFMKAITENKVFKQTYNELINFDRLDEEKQKNLQFEKLKETLVYAKKHVPYYTNIFNDCNFKPENMKSFEDMKKIPILTKEKVIEAGDKLYSDEDIQYYTAYTGGSSGKALKCLLEKDSYYKERAFFSHFLEPLGYNPGKSRSITFMGHNKGKKYYFSPVKGDIAISPFRLFKEDEFEDIYKLFVEYRPEFINGYASAIVYFARQCKKYDKKIQLKGCVFTSENWSKEDAELVEESFDCKVVSTYGHTERAVFAAIVDGNCVFDRLYGYTELIPTDLPNEYQIACTGFISRKMPLIRYVTDDVIRVTDDGKYELIGHRKSDVHLVGKNKMPIFKGALTIHMEETQKIKAYQYVQNEMGKAELHIVQDEVLTEKELESIRKYINIRSEGLLDIKIKIVSEIKRTPRGKYIWAICNIE